MTTNQNSYLSSSTLVAGITGALAGGIDIGEGSVEKGVVKTILGSSLAALSAIGDPEEMQQQAVKVAAVSAAGAAAIRGVGAAIKGIYQGDFLQAAKGVGTAI